MGRHCRQQLCKEPLDLLRSMVPIPARARYDRALLDGISVLLKIANYVLGNGHAEFRRGQFQLSTDGVSGLHLVENQPANRSPIVDFLGVAKDAARLLNAPNIEERGGDRQKSQVR
jgi:hypothetical protein